MPVFLNFIAIQMINTAVIFVTDGTRIWSATDHSLARYARLNFLRENKKFKGRATLNSSSGARVHRSKDGAQIDISYLDANERPVFRITYFKGTPEEWVSRR